MERILILGCGGAGKSTLARALGEKTGIPVVHLDKIWWREGWKHIPREEFDRIHLTEIQKPQWIIDGNYARNLPERIEGCDTAIYLDFPRWRCLLGVAKRILTTYGTVRPDMGPGCPERLDWEFLKWVWNFNKNNRAQIYELLNRAEHVQVHILKNRSQVREFLEVSL